MDDTRELLQRMVDQNDSLIGMTNIMIGALQDVVDKLDAIRSQMVENDVSGDVNILLAEVSTISAGIEALAKKR